MRAPGRKIVSTCNACASGLTFTGRLVDCPARVAVQSVTTIGSDSRQVTTANHGLDPALISEDQRSCAPPSSALFGSRRAFRGPAVVTCNPRRQEGAGVPEISICLKTPPAYAATRPVTGEPRLRVAQIVNLPYRRLPVGLPSVPTTSASEGVAALIPKRLRLSCICRPRLARWATARDYSWARLYPGSATQPR
jgi:hypothetical protein